MIRNIIDGKLVMFGSLGTNFEGNRIKAVNYVSGADKIVATIYSKLYLIKGESWANITLGLPLFDKIKDPAEYDVWITKTINEIKEVDSIKKFNSKIINNTYSAELTIIYKGNEVDIYVN